MMKKRGSIWEQVLYPILGIIVVLLIINFAFIGENAWFVKLGFISQDTANSLSQIYSFGPADEQSEENLTAPSKVKTYFNDLKANIKAYQKSYDRHCIFTFEQDKLERQYSVTLVQDGENVELQLRKGRAVILEKETLDFMKVCTVAGKHYVNDIEYEYILHNRLDIENSGSIDLDSGYVYFDGDFDAVRRYFVTNPLNKHLVYKVDDTHFCLFIFSNPLRTNVPLLSGWLANRYGDASIYTAFINQDDFFKEGGQYYRPTCKEKLPEYKFETIYNLTTEKQLNLTTAVYTREVLTDEKQMGFLLDIEAYYNDTFFGGLAPVVKMSDVVNMDVRLLKQKLRPGVQDYAKSYTVNVDVFPIIEKKV
ncbi:MAG: hypothetical protein U9R08_05500 [Nanoarchaeota archaeon]|nr:hypothetical protein [Nanoarchaeota archaeon]